MTHETPSRRRVSRRGFLAAGAAVAAAAVAGCTEGTVNWFADRVFEEVNVMNGHESRVTGSIAVTGPDGETRLDDEFDVATGQEYNGEGDSPVFGDVWAGEGSYEVTVVFDDPVEDVTAASETVSVSDPDEQMLVVAIAFDDIDETVAFRVGDSLTDAVPEGDS
jgi:hypothetical protein